MSPRHDPWALLGVAPGATEEALRAAYLAKVQEFPPDRRPAQFEQIRDAWAALRDPRARARLLLEVEDDEPFTTLGAGRPAARRWVGLAPWLRALQEG